MATTNDIKAYWRQWLWRDALTRVITINTLVWLLMAVLWFVMGESSRAVVWLAVPRSLPVLATRPWTVLTYMWVHTDFLHMMVNMLWLMLFGRLFMQVQGGVRLVGLYIYGGLAGAAAFVALELLGVPAPQLMIGASCAVLAVAGAVGVLYPQWHVNLLIFGAVRIVWLVVAAAVFFVFITDGADETVAHGAGLLMGIVYGLCRKRGIDLTQPVAAVSHWLDSLSTPKLAVPRHRPGSPLSRAEEDEMDRLLVKVGRSGYASLSSSERQRLFDLSQRSKNFK